MDNPQTIISFCSGYGGLELGLELAGVPLRTAAYVEIETYAAANLVAKMEEGRLAPAPVYTNLKTFPSRFFCDRIHGILAGYPCQPFSVAGKRGGAADPRHLWPFIRKHIRTIRPVWCYFENVEGHLRLGFREVFRDLRAMGYAVEAGIYGTQELGFDFERERLFVLAVAAKERFRRWAAGMLSGEWQIPEPASTEQSVIWSAIEGRFRNQPTGRFQNKPLLDRRTDETSCWVDQVSLCGNGVVPEQACKAWITLWKQILQQ